MIVENIVFVAFVLLTAWAAWFTIDTYRRRNRG